MDLLDKGEKVIKKGMEQYFLLLYKDIFVILMHMFLKTLKLIGNIYYYTTLSSRLQPSSSSTGTSARPQHHHLLST